MVSRCNVVGFVLDLMEGGLVLMLVSVLVCSRAQVKRLTEHGGQCNLLVDNLAGAQRHGG